MNLEVEATYEDGVLKPDRALPLQEHERVTVSIAPRPSRIRRMAGFLKWHGDPEVLRRIAEDPDIGDVESP